MTEFPCRAGHDRFPPNVEQIPVEREATRRWLGVRRNEIELRIPLNEADCRYLAHRLKGREGGRARWTRYFGPWVSAAFSGPFGAIVSPTRRS